MYFNGVISINLAIAKLIAHNFRRRKRELELEPLDNMISKRIPGASYEELESERSVIREKYKLIQDEIDSAVDIDSLTNIVNKFYY